MKSIFRRPKDIRNKSNFVVMNTSFDSQKGAGNFDDMQGDGTAVSANDDESFLDEDLKAIPNTDELYVVPNDNNVNHDLPILNQQTLEANQSFQENEENEPMVEVMQSDNGNSVILGDDEEILMEKGAVAGILSRNRWGWMGRHDAENNNSAPRLPIRRFWAKRGQSTDESQRSGWTTREKVLLWITAFNTILIIILLGNNAAMVAQRNQTKSESFAAATNGCPDGTITPPTVDADPPSTWKPWNTTDGNSGSGGGGSNDPAPSPVTPVANATVAPEVGDPSSRCGCAACVESTWNALAGDFTCGERIMYLQTDWAKQYPTEVQACRQVAFEFPCVCGGCDPGRCQLPTPVFALPSGWTPPSTNKFGAAVTSAPTPIPVLPDASIRSEDQPLYCYPDASARTTYTLWDGMVIQPKASEVACGPGNNLFRSETVVVDTTADTLTMLYSNGVASEVRVLLPVEQRPFSYGTYRFSVKSVEVLNAAGSVISNVLPKELVLGLFTWDPFEVR
jgi:hypothetical protein